MRRFAAWWLLFVALMATLFDRVLGRGRGGLARFQATYADDHLFPVARGDRRVLPAFGRCIACGLCDRGEAGRIAAHPGYPGLMALVLSGGRSLPERPAAAHALQVISEAELAAKERLCPTQVPLRRLARFLRGELEPVDETASGP